jgi:hypothetical protein
MPALMRKLLVLGHGTSHIPLHATNDIYEFVGSTKASYLQFLDKRGRVSAKLSKVIVAVHKSALVFDVFVQQQNFIA